MIRCPECWRGFDSQEAKAAHHCTFAVPAQVASAAVRSSKWRWGQRYPTREWNAVWAKAERRRALDGFVFGDRVR